MPTLLNSLASSLIRRVRYSPFYYERYNNTCDFTTNRLYTQYARACHAAYAAKHPEELPPSPIRENAATVVKGVFPAEKARAYSAKITEMAERKDPCIVQPKEDGLAMHVREPLLALGSDILDVLRSPEVDLQLRAFFRGFYRIEWVVCYRSLQSKNMAGSWLWHSDAFPPHTCKMFLHLTKTTADTGAMELMNRKDTMTFRRAGYFGDERVERHADLEEFAAKHGLPYRPFHFDTEPGDVTIFDMNFLHRAVSPRAGFRDAVQFLFLPNSVSWEEQMQRDGGFEQLARRGARKLPKDPRTPYVPAPATHGTMV